MMCGLKIAVIGGGSTYTPELIDGFIRYQDELSIEQICLMDISSERLEVVGGLAQRMLQKSANAPELVLSTNRQAAIEGADFVLAQLRVGGLAARALDERIAMKHGILGQETTGPGGFAKALRTVPVMLDIAQEVAQRAPKAWMINFTNPSGMVTEAILRHTNIQSIGLCNVPLNMRMSVAKFLNVPVERIELDYVGLNHLSWARVLLDGEDVTRQVLETHWGSSGGDVDADFLHALGLIPNYYLRYFVHPDRVLAEQYRAEEVRGEYLQGVEADLLKMYQDPALTEKPALLDQRGGAYYSTAAVELIRAIALDRREVHIVNVQNGQAVPDLPAQSVVEIPAIIGKSGAHPIVRKAMPPEIRGLAAAVKAYEELTIEAAITGNEDTAKMALFSNPLVPSWGVAKALWADLKEAHRAYLPQFG